MKMASSTFLVGDSFALSTNTANWRPKRNGSEQNALFLCPPRTGMPSSFPFRWRSSTVRGGTAAAASAVQELPDTVVFGHAPCLSVAAALGVGIITIQDLGEMADAAVAHDHFA